SVTALLAFSGSTRPMRAPIPRMPRPSFWAAGGGAAYAGEIAAQSPIAPRSATKRNEFRIIAKSSIGSALGLDLRGPLGPAVNGGDVVDGLAVEGGHVRGRDVHARHELGPEPGVVVAEVESLLVGALNDEPLVSDAAAHVGLELRRDRELDPDDSHQRDEIRI